jgi:lipoate-protein ligase A
MILWCDGGHDPAENMRRDAMLLERAAGGAAAVLRLFTFVPPGITLGRAQDPMRELDRDRCRAAGLSWAVRPTGGRAIYHDEEWTYSLAAGLADPTWGGGLEAAYGKVSRLLVASLTRLGVPATLTPGAARGDLAPRAAVGAAAPCFASTARHEIVIEGRKLVGSAQRRTARALLQQGSLLLGDAHLRLADFLALPDPARERVRAGLEQASTHAGRWLGHRPPLARWADALQAELPRDTLRVEGDEGLRVTVAGIPPEVSAG